MCTILSELQRNDQAIVHARTALKLLLLELFGPNGYANQGGDDEGDEGPAQNDGQMEPPKLPPDRVAVLAIAYHNLAVQQEFLRMFKASLTSYEKACKVVTTHLEKDHPLVKSLTESFQQAQEKLQEKIARKEEIALRTSTKALKGGRMNAKQIPPPPLTNKELKLLSNFNGLDLTQDVELSDNEDSKAGDDCEESQS